MSHPVDPLPPAGDETDSSHEDEGTNSGTSGNHSGSERGDAVELENEELDDPPVQAAGVPRRIIICDVCYMSFQTMDELVLHKYNVGNQMVCYCQECAKEFLNECLLEMHKSFEHTSEMVFTQEE